MSINGAGNLIGTKKMKYDWSRLASLGYSEETVNELNNMVVGPALKAEHATDKPLMGQSTKRVKGKAIIQ